MNNILLYCKSHLTRSTVSAVDLAKNNPTANNISFAEKLLQVKLTSVKLKLQKNDEKYSSHNNKINKYKLLLKRLDAIENINKYKIEFNNQSIPLIKKKLNECIEKYKRVESSNDYRNIHFDGNDLSGICFKNRDLSNAKFDLSPKIFNRRNVGVDFSFSYLKDIDLSNVNMHGAIFQDSDLTNAKVKINIDKHITDFSNAKLDGAKLHFSNNECLNDYLNEDLTKGTPFKTIDTINDRYKKIKISLIEDIIKKINAAEMTDKVPIDSIIKNLIAKDYYIENNSISNFIKCLFEIKHSNKRGGGFNFHMKEKYIMTYLNVLSSVFDNKELKDFMLEKNGSFIKLMTLSLYHDNGIIKETARDLYKKYLNLDEVKFLKEKLNFSNGYCRINWKSKEYNNYILINEGNAIIVNHKNITKMLFSNEMGCTVKWDKFFLYIDGKYQAKEGADCDILFNETFKVFRNNRNTSINKIKIDNFLSSLNLGVYQEVFQSTWIDKPIAKDKLSGTEKYKNLSAIFEGLLVTADNKAKNVLLNPEHYEEIYKNFELALLNNKEKSKYLLSLAILIINYVGKYIFGSDDRNYKMLLNYACALMSKAHELNSELMGRKFEIWTNKLTNPDNKVVDTLYVMKKYANKHFEQIYRKIMPLHWLYL